MIGTPKVSVWAGLSSFEVLGLGLGLGLITHIQSVLTPLFFCLHLVASLFLSITVGKCARVEPASNMLSGGNHRDGENKEGNTPPKGPPARTVLDDGIADTLKDRYPPLPLVPILVGSILFNLAGAVERALGCVHSSSALHKLQIMPSTDVRT